MKKKGDGVLDSLDLGLFLSFSFSYWGFVVMVGGGGECVLVVGMLEFDVVVIFIVLNLVFLIYLLVVICLLRFCFLFFGEGVEFDFLLLKEIKYIFLVKYDFEWYFIDDV